MAKVVRLCAFWDLSARIKLKQDNEGKTGGGSGGGGQAGKGEGGERGDFLETGTWISIRG